MLIRSINGQRSVNLYVKIRGKLLLLIAADIVGDKVLMGCIASQRSKVPSTLEEGLAYPMDGFHLAVPIKKAA